MNTVLLMVAAGGAGLAKRPTIAPGVAATNTVPLMVAAGGAGLVQGLIVTAGSRR